MLIGSVDNTISHQNPYANKAENRQTADKTDTASKVESSRLSGALNEPHDEYIPNGDKPEKSPGIYRLEKDETGKQKIVFDRPNSAEKKEQHGELPEVASDQNKDGEEPEKEDGPEKSGDKKKGIWVTANTDKVDAEIKKLKEEKQQLEQQLKRVHDDEDKRKDLEKRLSQVEAELREKDNDAYRKQHLTITGVSAAK